MRMSTQCLKILEHIDGIEMNWTDSTKAAHCQGGNAKDPSDIVRKFGGSNKRKTSTRVVKQI
jgi:hypothetical protein